MAARLTCVVALGGAIVQVATAQAAEPPGRGATDEAAGSPRESGTPSVAEALRLTPRSGGCVPSWGPIAPPPADFCARSAPARDAFVEGGRA